MMSFILILSVSFSLSLLMQGKLIRDNRNIDKFILSFILYFFFILMITVFYTLIFINDQKRFMFSILFFVLIQIILQKKQLKINFYDIYTTSIVFFASILIIWEMSKINFIQDKFTSGDSYSYAFGALDLNSSGNIKLSDWTKFMTTLQAFVPSIIFFIQTLKNSSQWVDIETIISSFSGASIIFYSMSLLIAIRIISLKINNFITKFSLILIIIVFYTSDFVFAPLSLGSALNASISHFLILSTYFFYLVTNQNKFTPKFLIDFALILNILVLMNYPVMLPLSFGLVIYLGIFKKVRVRFMSTWFLVIILCIYSLQIFRSLVSYNSLGSSGSFALYDFYFYLIIFVFLCFINLFLSKFYFFNIYFLFVIIFSIFYLSVPYIDNYNLVLSYYNTKYLYLLMVPSLIVLFINFIENLEKNYKKHTSKFIVLFAVAISIYSSIYNNNLITQNLQNTQLRFALQNLSSEKNTRLYYVDYIYPHDELLLNLWADTRNIDYTNPWVKGNIQSQGVTTIFNKWQATPQERICAYTEIFPKTLIISRNEESILAAKKNCNFHYLLR